MARQIPGRYGGTLNVPEHGDPSLNPKGRPRRTVRVIIEEWEKKGKGRVSKDDILHAYETVINLTEDEMKVTCNDKDAPMLIRIVAKALLEKHGFDMLEIMLNRAYGKPDQKINEEYIVKHVVITKTDPKQIEGAQVIDIDYDPDQTNRHQFVSSTSEPADDYQ